MDLDFDMLDDLGTNQPQPPSKPTRFQPKTSKFKPKTTKQEPTTLIVNNQEDSKPVISVTVNPIVVEEKPQGLKCMEVEQLKEEDLMEEDTVVEEEDTVVREIDVYFNPSPFDANTELYVMQYPLRPSWRPYDLDSRCEEVRIKPKSCEVEIDLSLDTDNNFNKDKDGKNWATKQTLSSWKSPPTTGYAIGLLKGNKLYVNPVRAVLQLRPSMKHLIAEDKFEEKLEGSSKKQVQGKPLKIPIESDIPEDEPWVSLKYHGVDSDFSSKYRQQMALEDSSTLEFSMSEYDYINSLCPKSTMEKGKGRVSDRRRLLPLPLSERFKKYFSEGPQVNRFSVLKHFAPDESDEEVLHIIQKHAVLIQGTWVPKSKVLQMRRDHEFIRDFILVLFTKSNLITKKQIENVPLPRDIIRNLLAPLAIYRELFGDWKFRESTDKVFLKSYPEIVRKQEISWETCEYQVNQVLASRRSRKTGTSINLDEGAKKNIIETPSAGTMTMSEQTREALPKAIEEIIRVHKVCSLQSIHAVLRETVLSKKNNPKVDGKTVVEPVQDVCTQSELQTIIRKVAVDIHGQYVLKSSDNPTLNPLRSVVIKLLCAKGPNAKLKKTDISEAAKIELKKEIANSDYTQVMSELCVSVKGQWVLRNGDGKSVF